MSHEVGIVTCGRLKARHRCAAGRMYRSAYHRLYLAYAVLRAGVEHTFIISAKYGLVPLHQIIAPYDLRLGDPGSITAAELRRQAEALGILDAPQVFIVGAFRRYLPRKREIWPHISAPAHGHGVSGGELNHWMRGEIARLRALQRDGNHDDQ